MRPPEDQLRDLRKWRAVPANDPTLVGDISRLTTGIKQESGAAEEVGGALATLLPPTLVGQVSVRQFERAILVLVCNTAPHRYTLDSWMRSGGLALLRRSVKATIKSVRVT
ncbi:MAG: hypothetical protein ACOYN0_14730 [Phycisphaerales bacterium]